MEIPASVKVAEISGSETMIHFDAFGSDWVSLSHGVHPFDAGARTKLHADFSKAYYFSRDGQLAHGGEA